MARILVVENDALVREMLCLMLQEEDHCVKEVCDGQSAAQLIQTAPPDLLITDLDLPLKTGTQLIAEVRAQYPALKIIALTASPIEEITRGANLTFAKPLSNETLQQSIASLLTRG